MEIALAIYKLIGVYIPLLPFLIGLYKIKNLPKPKLFIWFMVIAEASINIYSYFQSIVGKNNVPSLHLLIFLEVLFAGIFYSLLIKKERQKTIVLWISILFLLYTSLNSFVLSDISSIPTIARSIHSYILVLFSLFYLFDILKRNEVIPNFLNSSNFWISSAILFYFGTKQTLYLFGPFLYEYDRSINSIFLNVHYGVSSSYYILLAIGLWKKN